MKHHEYFEEELKFFHSDKMRYLATKFLDEEVPEYFFHVAASSSGKYHPAYALGEGGLLRHTKAALKIAECLLNLEQNECLPHDEIIMALMFHDSFKHGTKDDTRDYTVFIHPMIAGEIFESFALENGLNTTAVHIANLIRCHMGQWNSPKDGSLFMPKPESSDEEFVHMCDYLASRKFITVEDIG